jgi:hypothetical protein
MGNDEDDAFERVRLITIAHKDDKGMNIDDEHSITYRK